MELITGYQQDKIDLNEFFRELSTAKRKELKYLIYRLGSSRCVFRDKFSDFNEDNIERFTLFQESSIYFSKITGIPILPWVVVKNFFEGKERLLCVAEFIEGKTIAEIQEDKLLLLESPWVLEKIENIYITLLAYIKCCFDSKVPFIPDMKVEQLLFTGEELDPIFVDVDPLNTEPHPFYDTFPFIDTIPFQTYFTSIFALFLNFEDGLDEEVLEKYPDFGKRIKQYLSEVAPEIEWNRDCHKTKFGIANIIGARRKSQPSYFKA
ncbi:MAG: hypothetical protein ABI721_00490 [Candidatus Dojkabacteria bacterium]